MLSPGRATGGCRVSWPSAPSSPSRDRAAPRPPTRPRRRLRTTRSTRERLDDLGRSLRVEGRREDHGPLRAGHLLALVRPAVRLRLREPRTTAGLLEKLLAGVESLKVDWDPNVVGRPDVGERLDDAPLQSPRATLKTGEVREDHRLAQRDLGAARRDVAHRVRALPRATRRLVARRLRPRRPPIVPAPAPAAAAETFPDIFFDYDKWNIRPDQIAGITIVLDYLKKYPTTEMTIEGHCDERGSTRLQHRPRSEARGRRRRSGSWARGSRRSASGRSPSARAGRSSRARSQGAWQSNRRSHFVVTKGPQRP